MVLENWRINVFRYIPFRNVPPRLRIIFLFVSFQILFTSLCFAAPNYFESLYAVTVNDQDMKQIVHVLTDNMGDIWLRASDLQTWRIRVPAAPPVNYNGHSYYRMRDLRGDANVHIDQGQGKLYIKLGAHDFEKNNLQFQEQTKLIPERSATPGAFLNYEFFASRNDALYTDIDQDTEDNYAQKNSVNGTIEVGVFNGFGVITSDFLLSNIGGRKSESIDRNNVVRLNTLWTIDNPSDMRAFRIGDSVSVPGLWGSSVVFGGLQWSSNFDTQPNFIKMALPSARGAALVPSTMELYVNNALRDKKDIPVGPFEVNNIPVVTGQGEVRLIVTDILGKQQIINVPYYADQEILQKGLHDFSFETGFIRNNYGINSNDYGDFIFSGTDNYGINNYLTSQLHAEVSNGPQNLGLGLNVICGNYGVLTASGAVSHSDSKHGNFGNLGLLSFTHSGDKVSYGFSSKVISNAFRPLGFSDDMLPPKTQNQVFLGFGAAGGSLSVNYTAETMWHRDHHHDHGHHNDYPENCDLKLLSASYSTNLFKDLFVSINGTRNLGGVKNNQIYLTLSLPLGTMTDTYASLSASRRSNDSGSGEQVLATIQKNAPFGTGYGYRVSASTGDDNKFVSGELDLRSNVGSYMASISRYQDSTSYQVAVSGGLTMMKGQIFASRRVQNSFALVDVQGVSGVPLYLSNQKVSVTNKNGYALIPDLIAYYPNQISVKPEELPLSVEVDNSSFEAIPYFRSGVYKKLPIRVARNALLTLKLSASSFVPAGALVKVDGNEAEFFVGNDGQLYLTDLKDGMNQITVFWGDSSCKFAIPYHMSTDPLPNLGTFMCH